MAAAGTSHTHFFFCRNITYTLVLRIVLILVISRALGANWGWALVGYLVQVEGALPNLDGNIAREFLWTDPTPNQFKNCSIELTESSEKKVRSTRARTTRDDLNTRTSHWFSSSQLKRTEEQSRSASWSSLSRFTALSSPSFFSLRSPHLYLIQRPRRVEIEDTASSEAGWTLADWVRLPIYCTPVPAFGSHTGSTAALVDRWEKIVVWKQKLEEKIVCLILECLAACSALSCCRPFLLLWRLDQAFLFGVFGSEMRPTFLEACGGDAYLCNTVFFKHCDLCLFFWR
jgi:hypothetical protein